MQYVWDFAILGKYSHLFWLGLGWTVAYTIGTVFLGTVIGLVVGILRLRRLPVIDWLLLAYIELFRCTPLLVQIIWFYYAFPVVIGVNIPAHVAAVTVLSLYGGAFYAEIVRGSIESIHGPSVSISATTFWVETTCAPGKRSVITSNPIK